jgi:hypothetical protein
MSSFLSLVFPSLICELLAAAVSSLASDQLTELACRVMAGKDAAVTLPAVLAVSTQAGIKVLSYVVTSPRYGFLERATKKCERASATRSLVVNVGSFPLPLDILRFGFNEYARLALRRRNQVHLSSVSQKMPSSKTSRPSLLHQKCRSHSGPPH